MLKILMLIFVFLIMIIGGERGVNTLIAWVGNILICGIAVWLMAAGVSVLGVTLGMSLFISLITLFYQNGNNEKTRSAFYATVITMLILLAAIYYVVWSAEPEGLNEIQLMGDDLLSYKMNLHISMAAVATAVISLSTLGTVLDLTLSITTSVYEIKKHNPGMTKAELIRSGKKMGKELIGTTANTLLFAYMGESVFLLFYLKTQYYTFEKILNSKILFQNLASILLGIISCVIAMQISAFLMARECTMQNGKQI